MYSQLKLVFLNINSPDITEDPPESDPDKNIDSPSIILDKFFNNHVVIDFEKKIEPEESNEIKYYFIYQIEEGFTVTCNFCVFSDLSKQHTDALSADAYIIFCNKEKNNLKNNLHKIFLYLNDNCDIKAQKSVIGVYTNPNGSEVNEEKMKEIIKNENGEDEYKYYEMNVEESIKGSSDNSLNAVLEKVFLDIYNEKKMECSLVSNPKIKKEKKDEDTDKSCFIF